MRIFHRSALVVSLLLAMPAIAAAQGAGPALPGGAGPSMDLGSPNGPPSDSPTGSGAGISDPMRQQPVQQGANPAGMPPAPGADTNVPSPAQDQAPPATPQTTPR